MRRKLGEHAARLQRWRKTTLPDDGDVVIAAAAYSFTCDMNLTLSSGQRRSMRVLCTLREDILHSCEVVHVEPYIFCQVTVHLIRTAKTSEKDLGNAGPSLKSRTNYDQRGIPRTWI